MEDVIQTSLTKNSQKYLFWNKEWKSNVLQYHMHDHIQTLYLNWRKIHGYYWEILISTLVCW